MRAGARRREAGLMTKSGRMGAKHLESYRDELPKDRMSDPDNEIGLREKILIVR